MVLIRASTRHGPRTTFSDRKAWRHAVYFQVLCAAGRCLEADVGLAATTRWGITITDYPDATSTDTGGMNAEALFSRSALDTFFALFVDQRTILVELDNDHKIIRCNQRCAAVCGRESCDLSIAIAHELGMSGRTMVLHRSPILEKMGTRNTSELLNQVIPVLRPGNTAGTAPEDGDSRRAPSCARRPAS